MERRSEGKPFMPGNGTWTIPEHMNAMNEEETSRYVGKKEENEDRWTRRSAISLSSRDWRSR